MNIRKCSMCRKHHGDDADAFKDHKCKYNNDEHIANCTFGCKIVAKRRKSVAKVKNEKYHFPTNKEYIPPMNTSPTEPSEVLEKKTKTCTK